MNKNNRYRKQPNGFATKAIHIGQEGNDSTYLEVVAPIVTSTIFKQYNPGDFKLYDYGRSGNPTRQSLEKCLAALDNAKYSLTFGSGMGAVTAISELLESGDHIILSDDVYGETNRYCQQILRKHNVEVDLIDVTNMTLLKDRIKKNTKMLWFETPTNPCMNVIDIEMVSKLCHAQGNIIVVVDNTFLSSYFQRPLDLGADIVLYSLTKYANGHHDVIMGSIVTNSDSLYEKIKFIQEATGIIPSPFDCYQVNRGLKTLALRMEKHQENAFKIAQFLEMNPNVEKVLYPGLHCHSQYDLSLRQTYGSGGMLSFYLKGGMDESKRFFKALKYFILAGSLGGCVSTIALPSLMTHTSLSVEDRRKLGITDNLIRVSVGLEDVEDLIKDLENSLKASQIHQCNYI